MGEDQCQRLVQAIGQDLDVEFGPQLLPDLGDGVLPVRLGCVVACRERRCGGGLVAEELGHEGGEWLASCGGVW
jgi:hypothetical protein